MSSNIKAGLSKMYPAAFYPLLCKKNDDENIIGVGYVLDKRSLKVCTLHQKNIEIINNSFISLG